MESPEWRGGGARALSRSLVRGVRAAWRSGRDWSNACARPLQVKVPPLTIFRAPRAPRPPHIPAGRAFLARDPLTRSSLVHHCNGTDVSLVIDFRLWSSFGGCYFGTRAIYRFRICVCVFYIYVFYDRFVYVCECMKCQMLKMYVYAD